MPAARSKRRAAIKMLIQRRHTLSQTALMSDDSTRHKVPPPDRFSDAKEDEFSACKHGAGRMRRRAADVIIFRPYFHPVDPSRGAAPNKRPGWAPGSVSRMRENINGRDVGCRAALRASHDSHLNHTAAQQAPARANTPYRPKNPGVWLITGEPHSPSWIAKPVMASIARRPL